MICLPTAKELVLSVACAMALSVWLLRMWPPSKKIIVPVGIPTREMAHVRSR